ncbi:AAA family ATPase [Cognaticolwellia beringensis]|uniref:Shikimate kinase n=1 Tax=Cognaticolwellia beringensis TaxID=1967665 RepID=A0A222GCF1_9GAMM|nr:AAA family ATPase [Cognaticolwellia beringensis]ASP49044.1 shikimate kinase [Cognaticolwellia beringensis]
MLEASCEVKRIVIFGNSASGKSSLAKMLAEQHQLAHLDLDTLAWLPITEYSSMPQRQSVDISVSEINTFIKQNNQWVIEGCYSDLLSHSLEKCSEVIFLNLPIELCFSNAKNRPWEAHKYKTKADQDNNLPMLLDWISQYESRTDTFSKAAHKKLYDEFIGKKTQHIDNQ